MRDAVVLTGDVRAHRAADLELDHELDHDDPTGPSAGSEKRGYVLTTIERDRLTADFKVVPYVRTPAPGPPSLVENRVPGVRQSCLRPVGPALRADRAITVEDTVRLETERP